MAITVAGTPVANSFSDNATGISLASAYTPVAAHNTLVAGLASIGTGAGFTFGSDSGAAGNTFTAVPTSDEEANGYRLEWFICQDCNAGATNPQFATVQSTTFRLIWFLELTGTALTGQPDAATGGASTGNPYSINITTVADNAMVLAGSISANTTGVGSGWDAGPTASGCPSEYKIIAAHGLTAVPFTDSGSSWGTISAISIAPGGGAPSSDPATIRTLTSPRLV